MRVTINGAVYDLSDQIKLDKNKKHSISIVIDRQPLTQTIVDLYSL